MSQQAVLSTLQPSVDTNNNTTVFRGSGDGQHQDRPQRERGMPQKTAKMKKMSIVKA